MPPPERDVATLATVPRTNSVSTSPRSHNTTRGEVPSGRDIGRFRRTVHEPEVFLCDSCGWRFCSAREGVDGRGPTVHVGGSLCARCLPIWREAA